MLRAITPVFNDWPCFIRLIQELDPVCATVACRVSVLAVDEGSTEAPPRNPQAAVPIASLNKVELAALAMNVGRHHDWLGDSGRTGRDGCGRGHGRRRRGPSHRGAEGSST